MRPMIGMSTILRMRLVAVGVALGFCLAGQIEARAQSAAAPQIARKLSQDETLRAVTVAPNATLQIKGVVRGYKANVYAVTLDAGETLEARFESKSASAYFNVIDGSDASGAALHRGDVDGAVARVTATRPTTYLIQPYLVRAAARRGTSAPYVINLSRGSGAAQNASAGPTTFAPASAAKIRFSATGQFRCSVKTASLDRLCNFGAVRRGGGAATLHIASPSSDGPAGAERILEFAGERVTSPQPGAVSASKSGDTWLVGVDGIEFYQIPEGAIVGG